MVHMVHTALVPWVQQCAHSYISGHGSKAALDLAMVDPAKSRDPMLTGEVGKYNCTYGPVHTVLYGVQCNTYIRIVHICGVGKRLRPRLVTCPPPPPPPSFSLGRLQTRSFGHLATWRRSGDRG